MRFEEAMAISAKQILSRKGKRPITPEQYRMIRRVIRKHGGRFASRNLLLVNLQTNACISSADVLKLKTGTVFREGRILNKFWINQKKIKRSQLVSASASMRSDIRRVMKDYARMFGKDYFSDPCNPLFPSQRIDRRKGSRKPLSYTAYRNMLRQTFIELDMDTDLYGTHSLRSAVPHNYFRHSGDAKGTRALYHLKKGRTTIRYIEKTSRIKAIEIRKELLFND